MILTRILAVLSAASLVGAFTLGTVLTPFESLAELLGNWDHDWLLWLTRTAPAHLPAWCWEDLIVPVLQRPAWLMPTSLGLVLLGCAITIGSRKSVARSHRRRS